MAIHLLSCVLIDGCVVLVLTMYIILPLATIQNNSTSQADSKKAYQGIKFLVGLANK